MDMKTYELIGQAYSEVEAKEEWCDRVTPVCDIGVLSVEAIQNFGLLQNDRSLLDADIGAGRILIEGKYQFSVIDAEVDFSSFKVIVLPDKIEFNDSLSEKLKKFIANGGKILASGRSGIKNEKFFAYKRKTYKN